MANATINTTYVGQLATPFVAPAILSADTIANGYISVLENVRHEANLKIFTGVAISDRSCEFDTPSSGQLVLDDVVLTTSQLQVNEQICNFDLARDWAAAQMKGADAAAPNAYTGYLSQYVGKKVAADVEKNIWHGSYNSTTGAATGGGAGTSFGGLMAKYVAGSGTNESLKAGAWQGLTASTSTNIMNRLADLVANAPDAIAGDPDAAIYMSRKSANIYYQALSKDYNLPFLNDGLVARYAGYTIYTPAGFPDDTAILSKKENLYFGTNVLTDMIEARMLDLTGVTGDAVTRVIMLFDAGCQIVDEASMACVRRSS